VVETGGIEGSFWDHLEDFRKTILSCAFVIIFSSVIALFFYENVFYILTTPLRSLNKEELGRGAVYRYQVKRERIVNEGSHEVTYTMLEDGRGDLSFSKGVRPIGDGSFLIESGGYIDFDIPADHEGLVVFSPIEGMLTTFKVSFWVGLVCSAPIWMFIILSFFSPGLKHKEKRLVFPFILMSLIFMGFGVLFSLTTIIPLANSFLYAFNANIGNNLWALSQYLSFTTVLLLSNVLAFELFVLLLFLVHLGILSSEALQKKRRIAIVSAFVLGAVLTPPDVLTQCLLASILIIFYELAIVYARVRSRRKRLA
jgi:sec-independent protein translocase protein TatC